MADFEVPQGPWHKPFNGNPRRVEFAQDAQGRGFAFRPREVLLLRNADVEGNIEVFLDQMPGPEFKRTFAADLATRVAICRLSDAKTLGEEGNPLANVADINQAQVVRIQFTPEMWSAAGFDDKSMIEVMVEMRRAAHDTGFSPSLNTVFFSAQRRMFGSPVMWSGVGGAPVMWSSVDGTPVMWSGVGGAPVMWSGDLTGAPVMWSAVDGTPVMWSGVEGEPVMWSGEFGATPVMWSGSTWGTHGNANCCCCCDDDLDLYELEDENIFTSARAALDPGFARRRGTPPNDPHQLGEGSCLVVVLDTGVHDDANIGGVRKIEELDNADPFNVDNDAFVDAAAGHGTFIAGLIRRLAPEANILVGRVLSSFGDGSECVVSAVVRHLADKGPGILNLSFVGYYPDDEPPPVLKSAIDELVEKGWIVVAAAGNDATCRKAFPAAMDDVIGVGALAPWGPAWFTNYGDWVDACAPGFDIVSDWYDFKKLGESEQAGALEEASGNRVGGDPVGVGDLKRNAEAQAAEAHGWAAWSGTSFSAPIVAAALARDVISAGWEPVYDVEKLREDRQAIVDPEAAESLAAKTAALIAETPDPIADNGDLDLAKTKAILQQARMRVIEDWRLARVPCLGTIVNDHL